MKKSLLAVALTIAVIWSAQSQNLETRSLSSFSKISVHQGITAILTKGNAETAKVETSGVDVSEVLTEVSGGALRIAMKGNNYRNQNVTVYVTFKSLNDLKATSSGSIEVKDFFAVSGDLDVSASSSGSVMLKASAEEADLDVSSSGNIQIELKAKSIEAGLSSSGDIEISGSCDELEVDASSAGDFDGYDLEAKNADLEASSGSTIEVTVLESLDAEASSGASIRYRGSPKNTNSDSSSGGSVKKSN